ncbi:hypothetical protein MdSGHV080 [Musca domestica salivary gland hypertrophy virus]|uniref:Uncharacterized protein n=1 Tax=Musca hytrovirus(isolate Musca domestica/United States/Boucias/-) TaxID=523909 RepID=B2YG57_MHVB|nr:hypothetical protein MdSGHV080 [Musca domestica salivary gland hypertrophy virus]ACD03539.1 hypothetical protein MdSGHV080 [Musca domestica salivary gland hypertrophy virus]
MEEMETMRELRDSNFSPSRWMMSHVLAERVVEPSQLFVSSVVETLRRRHFFFSSVVCVFKRHTEKNAPESENVAKQVSIIGVQRHNTKIGRIQK